MGQTGKNQKIPQSTQLVSNWNLKPGPTEYTAEALPIQIKHSVIQTHKHTEDWYHINVTYPIFCRELITVLLGPDVRPMLNIYPTRVGIQILVHNLWKCEYCLSRKR